MPDWTSKVTKNRAGDLGGEEVMAACFFQGRGTAAGQITFGLVGGIGGRVIGDALANQKAAQARSKATSSAKEGYDTFDGSLASKIPNDKGVVAVTPTRMIVFGYKQGIFSTKIEDPCAVYDRSDITGWSYKSGKVTSILNLAFSDESTVGIELPRANKPDAFAAALEIPPVE